MQLRRQRFSIASFIPMLILSGLAIWAVIRFWPRNDYQPTQGALQWYEIGTDALRDGAYHRASKALQQAIAIDGNYALARARLAQAWTELDYIDNAKDELLAIQGLTSAGAISEKDSLYLDAIRAMAMRDFRKAITAYTALAELSPEDSPVYVDLGYAYENDGKSDKALENYLKAISLTNGQYATAFLRAGIVYHRQPPNRAKALEMFDKAEQLYRAASNNEGMNEVFRFRGTTYRAMERYDEAHTQFQQSLDAARTMGMEAQQISALIDLSYLASRRGQPVEAENWAQQAVRIAQEKHLENLAAAGLNELGNSYNTRQDYEKAEYYYSQAVQLARANKGRVSEAIGMSNLGGVYIATLRAEKGLPLVEEALKFFKEWNYPRSISLALTQMVRGYRRKGDYDSALRAANEKLELARNDGAQLVVASAIGELASVLAAREAFPSALKEYDDALKIYQSSKDTEQSIVFNGANRVQILSRLGQFDRAETVLQELSSIIANSKSKDGYKQIEPTLLVGRAQVDLGRRNFNDAIKLSKQALKLGAEQYGEVAIEGRIVLGMATALSGNSKEGLKICDEAVKISQQSGDFLLQSRALLCKAETALLTNDAQTALNLATEAQTRFARGEQYESEWRAWLIASRASEKLGDKAKAQEQLANALNVRSKLEQQWGAVFKQYDSRPDIKAFYQQQG
jgi:tetratricopeptide (TPR) repeat protein